MIHRTTRTPAMTKNALRASASTDSASPVPRSHRPRCAACWPPATLPGGPPDSPLPPVETMQESLVPVDVPGGGHVAAQPSPRRSGDFDGALGQAEPEAVDDRARAGQVARGGPERDEQRREVL